jgi:hypothetical protein
MAFLRRLAASPLIDLAPWLTGPLDQIAFGVGHDGALYAASRVSPEATEWTIVRWSEETGADTLVVRDAINVSYVQPYQGGVLLVAARCAWHPSGAEQNALVIDRTGRELRRLTLGDGIADVRASADGTIWVSYYDEGIFGNLGWGGPSGPEPLGAAGLVAFDGTGARVRALDASALGVDGPADVYAMTLAGDDVWIYYYDDFPIVRVGPTHTQVWAYGARGARAMAVRGHRVLLVGDYDHPGRARVVELRADGSRARPRIFKLVDRRGTALERVHCVGAGDTMYVLRGSQVLVVRDW